MTRQELIQRLDTLFSNFEYSSLIEDNYILSDVITLTCTLDKEITSKSIKTFLKGYGCSLCKNREKWRDKFIISNPNIDLSSLPSQFVNGEANLTLICPEHGEITKSARSFLHYFCTSCKPVKRGARPSNTNQWFIDEVNKQSSMFTFEKTNYIGLQNPVTITCKVHGDITKTASLFITGYLCNRCNLPNDNRYGAKKSFEDFKNQVEKVYPSLYDWSTASKFKSVSKPFTLTCNKGHTRTKARALDFTVNGCSECVKTLLVPPNKLIYKDITDRLNSLYGSSYTLLDTVVDNVHSNVSMFCPLHGTESRVLYRVLADSGCKRCSPSRSKVEKEIYDYVSSITSEEVIVGYRPSWMLKKELDIFIPKYNLAIEYHGIVYHHSSKPTSNPFFSKTSKAKDYHFNKWKLCKDNGIRLISIYDFKWAIKEKQEIYKSLISHALQLDTRVYARKCLITLITQKEAITFIKENHLEGYSIPYKNSSFYGMYLDSKLVMCSSIGEIYNQKSKCFILKLQRICTLRGYTVVGGISKFSKFLLKTHGEFIYQTTNDTGSVINGESLSSSSRYYWVDPKTLTFYHRNKTQKQNLEKNFKHSILKEDTETTYMERLGYLKIYDSGLTTLKIKDLKKE